MAHIVVHKSTDHAQQYLDSFLATLSALKTFFLKAWAEKGIAEQTDVSSVVNNGKLANQIARLVVLVVC